MIRWAKKSEIPEIKIVVDSFSEMDTIDDTFNESYYNRIIKKGILFVAEENKIIVGVCFGTYNTKEEWADLLGLVVKKEYQNKGIGTSLVIEFEKFARNKKLKTIDLYADKNQINLFKKLNYMEGRSYIAFRKKLD